MNGSPSSILVPKEDGKVEEALAWLVVLPTLSPAFASVALIYAFFVSISSDPRWELLVGSALALLAVFAAVLRPLFRRQPVVEFSTNLAKVHATIRTLVATLLITIVFSMLVLRLCEPFLLADLRDIALAKLKAL